MKRNILLILIAIITFFNIDVHACEEIKELKSDIGTVSVVDSSNYLITVPEGTTEVKLEATTDYTWIEGYGPRTIPTNEEAELKVDGNACGFGIYTYFVKFKTFSNLIAENTPNPTPETNGGDISVDEAEIPSTSVSDGDSSLKLSVLQVKNYDIGFDPDVFEYSFDVDYDVLFLRITTDTEDENVTVQISDNAFSLKEGVNVVTITLTDTLGNTKVYTLNVNRVLLKSDNNYLANISITGYQFNFDPGITTYTLTIGNESTLNISAFTESELATYQILGNDNLEDGSVIKIRVTAEDGSTRDYIINIVKEFNIMDYWIYILIILLLVLMLIILLIMRQKKNKKKLGPEALAAQAQTAGLVKEIAPQNAIPEKQPEASAQNTQAASPTEKVTLKIIEPTNIEVQATPENDGSLDENSPTEVFQL